MIEPRILWKIESTGNVIHSPPISPEGRLYCASGDGRVCAVEPSGEIVWDFRCDSTPLGRHRLSNRGMITQSGHLAVSGLVEFPQGNRQGELTKLMMIRPDGQLEWECSFKGDGVCGLAEAADGTVLFSAPGKELVAFSPYGDKKWQFKAEGKIITAPCIGSDGTIYVGAANGKVYAVNPDGEKKWEFRAGGPAVSELAIVGGGICFGTYHGDLVVLDSDGEVCLKATLAPKESAHFGSPIVFADGTIVLSSYRAIHAIARDGIKKWSYEFRSDIYAVCPALAADGSLYIAADDNRLDAISADGKKLWDLPGIPTGPFIKPTRPVLTEGGVLYLASEKTLFAIQCPSGLADAPWPMSGQNPRATNRADPKFKETIDYGWDGKLSPRAIEICSTRTPMPMPEKPFTKQDVLQQLDNAGDFPMLDNGYVFPATVRLSAFRDELRWALVIEIVGWNNRSSGHEAVANALYCYGNWLNQAPGLVDDGFLYPTSDGEESSTFDDQQLDAEARTIRIRDHVIEIPRLRKQYAALGIKLEEPGVVKGHELLRALVVEHRELFLATDDELRRRVADLPLVLRLDEWCHPDISGDEKPSQSETFQMIADVLASDDPAHYRPNQPPNTHWKHWPMAGQL